MVECVIRKEKSDIGKEKIMAVDTALSVEASEIIEFIKKGQITIPKRVRDHHQIAPGQKGTLIDLDGGFLILPKPSLIPAMFDEIRDGLGTSDMSLEEMLAEMRRIRETSDYEA